MDDPLLDPIGETARVKTVLQLALRVVIKLRHGRKSRLAPAWLRVVEVGRAVLAGFEDRGILGLEQAIYARHHWRAQEG